MALYINDINFIPLHRTIAANVTKGNVALIQDVYGIYEQDVDVTERTEVAMAIECWQVTADKETGTGTAIQQGDWVYLDPTNARVSATQDATYTAWCGWCKKAATASDDTVLIRYDGTDPNRA